MNEANKVEYRWGSALEWFYEWVGRERDAAKLQAICTTVAEKLDGDQIQDLFQSDMDADGYFKPVRRVPVLFHLDDGGETLDVVFYCSAECRAKDMPQDHIALGESADWVTGTVCAVCEKPLD